MRIQLLTTGLLVAICACGLNGCIKKPAGGDAGQMDQSGEHAHEDEGPHGGHIIEIGAESHHAELVHDEASHKVGVYVLDGDARMSTPIETKSVTINVAEDGAPTQYELPAVPQSGEGDGKSSYYEIISEPLCKVVSGESEAKSVQARVSIQIGERPYVGLIETEAHDHDHAHGHEGEHSDKHADEQGEKHDAEHTEEHVEVPGFEPATEPSAEPAAEPAGEPSAEPVGEASTEPAAEPGAEPGTEDAAEPGAEE